MEQFRLVEEKLEAFIRKYYVSQILKGSILFLSVGLLYFLVTVISEYFFWFSTSGRGFLFWIFVIVEIALLVWFIGIPLLKLFKLGNRIDRFQASEIIGSHFPEVNDKLKNLLQLQTDRKQSDLLLASIEQRSRKLSSVPFSKALDLKENRKYGKYLIFPILIILGLVVAGKAEVITKSFSRISDYRTVYLKPAPFRFLIQNSQLRAREGEDFTIQVKTVGNVIPAGVQLEIDGERRMMKQQDPGLFEYTFPAINEDIHFRFVSNEVSSDNFKVEVIKVPKLLNFEINLDYPDYTGEQDEKISGSGNITVPEGTKIEWIFKVRNTDLVQFNTGDSLYTIATEGNEASFIKNIKEKLNYSVSTSNENIREFEKLEYLVQVLKDEYPKINVSSKQDSLDNQIRYFKGEISDDYGLSLLKLVYFQIENPEIIEESPINISSEAYNEFHYSFPGQLQLEPGKTYEYYFEVYDNDKVNGAKSSKSQTFSFRKKTENEATEDRLIEQNQAIERIGNKLDEFRKSDDELDEFSRLQKEKNELTYNERKKFDEFLKRQKEQTQIMKNYSEKLERSLEYSKADEDSFMKEELQQRLRDNEKKLEENEELLRELEELSDKIQQEDLGKKLEELSKKNQNNQRNLEQLLELTKRYYVEEKKQKLARELEELSERQEQASEKVENKMETQEKLNTEFQEFRKEMDDLEKENNALKQPKDLGREKVDEEGIQKDQKDATEKLERDLDAEGAKEKQKNAAEKMKEMSENLRSSSMQMQQQQLEADAEMLRQILDNLLLFSFEQEALLNTFKTIQQNSPNYAAKLRVQSNLRENFRHVDDSLYVLALRNPMIDDVITQKLTDVEFDLNKSLERLSDNEIPQGTASQQYVVTGANDLANLLDEILSSMQNMLAMPQPGQGQGEEEFQLQDIIEQQKNINGQMKREIEERSQDGEIQQGNEEGNAKLYEIYKEQQILRRQLQDILGDDGNSGTNNLKEMEEIEEQLLNKKFDPETLQRMQNLEYELLELEKAFQQQGIDPQRKSSTNELDYTNTLQYQLDSAKEYFNSTEILNRQTLPLRQIYKQKVKEYFGKGRN